MDYHVVLYFEANSCKNKIHIRKGIIILGFPIGQLMSVESDQPLTDFFKQTKVSAFEF